MDTDTLVNECIDDGKKFVEELLEGGFDVVTAFWLRRSDKGKWYFYVVSPLVDLDGRHKARLQLHPFVYSRPQPVWIKPLRIKLIGPSDPIARDVMALNIRAPGSSVHPYRWGGTRLGNMIIDGAYLYAIPAAAV